MPPDTSSLVPGHISCDFQATHLKSSALSNHLSVVLYIRTPSPAGQGILGTRRWIWAKLPTSIQILSDNPFRSPSSNSEKSIEKIHSKPSCCAVKLWNGAGACDCSWQPLKESVSHLGSEKMVKMEAEIAASNGNVNRISWENDDESILGEWFYFQTQMMAKGTTWSWNTQVEFHIGTG